MAIKTGVFVKYAKNEAFVGQVTQRHVIRYCGKRQEVFAVAWDNDGDMVPMQCRDEGGSNKKGYLPKDLVEVDEEELAHAGEDSLEYFDRYIAGDRK